MWLSYIFVFPNNSPRVEYTSWTHRQSYNYWSIQKCHYYCLKLDTGYSTVFYSVGSCTPTQRSWTITDFILHLHLHCRSIKFAPVSVWFPVSRLLLQLFCLPLLMLRSLHLIEVESIIAKKKKNCQYASTGADVLGANCPVPLIPDYH